MIPALFLTRDRDIDAALFCLRMLANKGLHRGLDYLIAVQSAAAAARFRRELPADLRFRCIRTAEPVGDTLLALVAAAGPAPAVFFALSDRYPIKPVAPAGFAAMAALAGSGQADAVRLCHWREALEAAVVCRLPDGTGFRQVRPGDRFGSWHPQFLSRRLLDRLAARTRPGQSLTEWQQEAVLPTLAEPWRLLVPETQITVFEEPLRHGRQTLNYLSRVLAGTGRSLTGTETIDPVTVSFTDPAIAKLNEFYRAVEPAALFARRPAPQPYSVHALGGVGSKMLVKWLYAPLPFGARPERLVRVHRHWRLPPLTVPRGQTMIYVFGNPVDSVLSFFARRHRRHDRHGFGATRVPAQAPLPAFALQALRNCEALPGPLTAADDAASYPEHGQDLFRIEEHLNNHLYADRPYPILFLRYETLWRHAGLLAELFPHAGPLPAHVPRSDTVETLPAAIADRYLRIYQGHLQRSRQLPDVFVMQGGAQHVLA